MNKKKLAHDMAALFKDCNCKHKEGCFAESCEECILRFLNDFHCYGMDMKSSELMKMAEDGLIDSGRIVVDQEGNEFIFTGKSFQTLDLEKANKNKYYGLCIDDNWTITDEVIDIS